ncbi:MAG: DUF255 domain-containing protein [Verrucomicrobiota bacterium JB023]|nr:DUF255 domain-containing protein [Verrucomicrobiota bacterium JB023]
MMMPIRPRIALACMALLLSPSCKENPFGARKAPAKEQEESVFSSPLQVPEEATRNRLAHEPTDFLRSQAGSAINWQPWDENITDLATSAQRLIFVVVGSNQHPASRELLDLLAADYSDLINERYLPVLADQEVDPSLAMACQLLSRESAKPVAFPFLLLLSHEGYPIGWTPMSANRQISLEAPFLRVEQAVHTVWEKSPKYVIENSRFLNEKRLTRFTPPVADKSDDETAESSLAALFIKFQRLAQLYDPVARRFDGVGGLPPSGLLTSLGRLAHHPGCPSKLRKNAADSSREALSTILRSAIRDPLDGAFFARRLSPSFSIPTLTKHLNTQAAMLSAITSSEVTPLTERSQERLLTYLNHSPPLSTVPANAGKARQAYFWESQKLQDLLDEREWEVVKLAFDISNIGNLASGDDPTRAYFRKNSLGLKTLPEEMANQLGITPSEASRYLAGACEKLAKNREAGIQAAGGFSQETTLPLSTQARLLTGLALSASWGGPLSDESLSMAAELADRLITDYYQEGQLYRIAPSENHRGEPALANDYALLIESLLAYHRLTLDDDLFSLSIELATHLLDHHVDSEHNLSENPLEASLLPFSIQNWKMIFGPSTWGTAYGALRRLQGGGFEHPALEPILERQESVLEPASALTPVVHTDFLAARLNTWGQLTLVLSGAQTDAELTALRQQLLAPEFDSILTMRANERLPQPEGAALLRMNGETVRQFESLSEVIPALRNTLQTLK